MLIDATGVTPTDLAGWKERIEEIFRDALGTTLVLDTETPQGQIIGLLALAWAEGDEVAVAIANGLSLYHASGSQLDILGSLVLTPRIAGERSIVTATLAGVADTIVDAGLRAKTEAGDVFLLDDRVIIPASGSIDATFRSENLGPVAAAVGTLNTFVTLVSGLTSITNAAAGAPGRNAEADSEYRARIIRTLAHNGRDGVENIQATVLGVEGCDNCLVVENASANPSTIKGVTVAARSILTIAEGGTDGDIAGAILRAKPAGVATDGTVSADVVHGGGRGRTTVMFRRVTLERLKVALTIRPGAGFPSNGLQLIQERCVQWINGSFEALPEQFNLSGLGIGEDIDTTRILTPIQSVPGHRVTVGPTVTLGDGTALPATLDLDKRYTLAAADVVVSLDI